MDNIIGHENEKKLLCKLVEEDKVNHAYLFLGKDGIGKKMLAIEFAKKINGVDFLDEADFKIITPENNIIKVEEIRDLISQVYLKPIYLKRKIFIIDDADKMNVNAQNALLKILEEPPIYATIILIVSNKEKIIKTIQSRVTEIKFNALTDYEIEKIIGSDINVKFARGSVSKAKSLIENNYFDVSKEIIDLFEQKNFLNINKKINENKDEITKILEFIKLIYHSEINKDTSRKVKIIGIIDEAIKNLNRNANTDMTLDKMIIQICKV